MTEKRFTIDYDEGNWWAVKDGDITLWKEEVVCLLNQLNDENEQIKQSNKELLLLVDTLKKQNMKFKLRLDELGVEYYD